MKLLKTINNVYRELSQPNNQDTPPCNLIDDEDEYESDISEFNEETNTENRTLVLENESTQNYVYAPKLKTLQGTKTLCVIGLKWKNKNNHADIRDCRNMANFIRKFYLKNSRGEFKIKTSCYVVNVPYNAANKNQRPAEKMAMNLHKGYDMYAIMSSLNALVGKRASNAGNGVAHLRGDSYRTGAHEIGHLLGLRHSGAYVKGKLDQYGDGQSVMGSMPSNLLTASQYYSKGWLNKEEVALFRPGMRYELKKVSDVDKEGLTAVLIKTNGKRDAWVSRPLFNPNGKKSISLHLSTHYGSSSQRIKVFGKGFYDKRFTGLRIKREEILENGNIVISIEKVEV